MYLEFAYDEDKDIDCLLSKGPGSTNSPNSPTNTYSEYLLFSNGVPTRESARSFIQRARPEDLSSQLEKLQTAWNIIAKEYQKRAESVFGCALGGRIHAYLTVAGRFPYDVEARYFYVSAFKDNANTTAMHELWHFYTAQRFLKDADVVGAERYNDAKEALTVLLNEVCANLMNGAQDRGYPQHEALRSVLVELWRETNDIQSVWERALQG